MRKYPTPRGVPVSAAARQDRRGGSILATGRRDTPLRRQNVSFWRGASRKPSITSATPQPSALPAALPPRELSGRTGECLSATGITR